MYEAGEKGRTSRELAEEIMLQEFGTDPESQGRLCVNSPEIVGAIDGKRYEEFPCYIPARGAKASRPA